MNAPNHYVAEMFADAILKERLRDAEHARLVRRARNANDSRFDRAGPRRTAVRRLAQVAAATVLLAVISAGIITGAAQATTVVLR
jgi:hypothetical protein